MEGVGGRGLLCFVRERAEVGVGIKKIRIKSGEEYTN